MPDVRDLARRILERENAYGTLEVALARAVFADDTAEDEEIARIVRERDAADTGERMTLPELAESVGVDLDSLADDTAKHAIALALAAQLRASGRTYREIAAEFGVATTTVIRWLDPDYAQREREHSNAAKERRRRPCPECGTPMSSDGAQPRGHTVRLCRSCDRIRRTAERVWTRDAVIDAIRRYAVENGRPPRAKDWLLANPEKCYPSFSSVYSGESAPFAKWADAVEAAGFPRPHPGTPYRGRSVIAGGDWRLANGGDDA